MKRFVTALLASALLATSPAWAGGGHGHDKHAEKVWKKERKAWEKEQKYWAKHGHYRDEYVVNHYYYPPPPVIRPYYVEPVRYAPPPGLQVVVRLPLN